MVRKTQKKQKRRPTAVAVFDTPEVQGEVIVTRQKAGVDIVAIFHKLPPGEHGFHIHKAGDMRQKDCMGLCEHYDKGRHLHGGGPTSKRDRHTGDLGNIRMRGTGKTGTKKTRKTKKVYCLRNVSVNDLWGRSIIVHRGKDDLGLGSHDDSHTTGHSGARMACAIFGRGIEG
jgi:Cu-Zn family superoxide dismutase